MKPAILTSIALCSVWVATQTFAAVTINVFTSPSVVMPNSSAIPDAGVFRYGTFDTAGFDLLSSAAQQNAETVSGLFSEYGSVNFSSGSITSVGQPLTGGAANEQLFAFVSDDSNLSSATAFGVFTSSNAFWEYPEDPGFANLTTSLVDSAVVGTLNQPTSLILAANAAVPEPSFFVFALPAFVLGLGAFRRRR